jgi:hypothetical protein
MQSVSLLDRYLHFTANFLPTHQRGDILAELRANLQAQMDDRAESFGRPLTEKEEADILKQHGHPMTVAARYLPVQRLIGGPWLALYWLVLRVALLVSAIVLTVRITVGAALMKLSGAAIVSTALQYPYIALRIFAWTTLGFAALDYFSGKYAWLDRSSWDPRKLPNFTLSIQQPQAKPLERLVGSIIGLAIVIGLRNWPSLLPPPVTSVLQFNPAWHAAYDLLLSASLLGMIAAFIVVLRPDWYDLYPAADLVGALLVLLGLKLLWAGRPWVSLVDPLRDAARCSNGVQLANAAIYWSIVGTMLAYAIAIVVYGWRCATTWRKRGKPISATPNLY